MDLSGVPLLTSLKFLAATADWARQILRLISPPSPVTFGAACLRAGLCDSDEAFLLEAAADSGTLHATLAKLEAKSARHARRQLKTSGQMATPALALVVGALVNPLPELFAGGGLARYFIAASLPLLSFLAISLALWLGWKSASPEQKEAFPLLGSSCSRAAARDYFECFGQLLDAGVPAIEALARAQKSAKGSPAAWGRRFASKVKAGSSLADAARTSGSPPWLDTWLAAIESGEAAGRLSESLAATAQAETESVESNFDLAADWLPKFVYAAVCGWMIWTLLAGPGLAPKITNFQ